MTAKCTAQLLADLGVTQSLSRPRVSNDNPYSEAQFKTVKYHPGFPGRFSNIEEAKEFCRSFFPWYNTEHRHGGIGLLTPAQVHFGDASEVIRQRQDVLAAAYAARPERFVAGPPRASELPRRSGSTPHSPSAQLTVKIGQRMVRVTTERRAHYTESATCLKFVDRFRSG